MGQSNLTSDNSNPKGKITGTPGGKKKWSPPIILPGNLKEKLGVKDE